MQVKEDETVGEYVTRLEARLRALEPPEGFTIQEWHVGQVYVYLLWRDDAARSGEPEALKRWGERIAMFEDRFPEQVKKFTDYMGWDRKTDPPQSENA